MKPMDEIQTLFEESQIKLTDAQEEVQTDKVLFFLQKMSASFPSEISWETGINVIQLQPLLHKLEKEGLIEKITPDLYKPDPRLLVRVPDQSAKDQGGFENFSKKRWFVITKKGLHYQQKS